MVVTYYNINPGVNTLQLDKNATPISVGSHNGQFHLEVLCSPSVVKEERKFLVVTTGENFPAEPFIVFIGKATDQKFNQSYFVFEI